jgi:hypothetical protein
MRRWIRRRERVRRRAGGTLRGLTQIKTGDLANYTERGSIGWDMAFMLVLY